MELVTESTPVVIGKFYLVKCAVMLQHSDGKYYVPIIGNLHKDPQFSVEREHYHIDGRFAKHDGCGQLYTVDAEGKTNGVVVPESAYRFYGIEIRKMKCKRRSTGLKPPLPGTKDFYGREVGAKYWKWYKSMVGKSCKGSRCPHLGTQMSEQNGVLVCPLHDLHGSVKDEVIIIHDSVR